MCDDDADGDDVPATTDCDDLNAAVGAPTTWYADADEDGFGDPADMLEACEQPEGYVANAEDCDDTLASINPDAIDIPNNDIDENCDGEDATEAGDANLVMNTASMNVDVNDDFSVTVDVEGATSPIDGAAVFISFDPSILEVQSITPGSDLSLSLIPAQFDNTAGTISYAYGLLGSSVNKANFNLMTIQFTAVGQGQSQLMFTDVGIDKTELTLEGESLAVNRTEKTITVEAPQVDSDGDGVVDGEDNCSLATNPDQADRDGDGVGDVCDICPDNADSDQSDFDNDGIGDACDDDADGDDIPATIDCDDLNPNVGGPTTWYADTDEDGFGDPADMLEACEQPEGYVANADDCDDTVGSVNPDATEIPNDGIDQDCDGEDLVIPTDLPQFILIDAVNDTEEGILMDNDIVNLFDYGAMINIKAMTVPEVVGSVLFKVNGTNVRTENAAPYALAGDDSGDYRVWKVLPGTYTICAIPFSEPKQGGIQGDEFCVTITIINEEPCVEQTWYADSDGDGFGVDDDTIISCEQPE